MSNAAEALLRPEPVQSGRSPTQMRLRRLLRNRAAVAGGAFVLVVSLLALLAPLITSADPTDIALANALKLPGELGLLGTDHLGRDQFTRVVFGARVSLSIGLAAALTAASLGTLIGLLVGYYRGYLDKVVMSVADLILSFPTILFAILLVTSLGPSLKNLILALVLRETPSYIRLVRSMVLSLREQDYVSAAQAMGARDARVLLTHLLPNIAGPIIVQSTFFVARAIINAANLGFLGLGVGPPTPEWGLMLSEARPFLSLAPHLVAVPGLAIVFSVLALNLFGDGLRDAIDPRRSK